MKKTKGDKQHHRQEDSQNINILDKIALHITFLPTSDNTSK